MAKIRSKQIHDFKQSGQVDWDSDIEFPSSQSIKETFLAQEQLALDDFTGNTYQSSGGTWSLTLSNTVFDNDPELVTIHVNGIKTNRVLSVNGTSIVIEQYPYDIESDDIIKVSYVKIF